LSHSANIQTNRQTNKQTTVKTVPPPPTAEVINKDQNKI